MAGARSELRALSTRLRLAGLQLHPRAVALHARDSARYRNSRGRRLRLADRSPGGTRSLILGGRRVGRAGRRAFRRATARRAGGILAASGRSLACLTAVAVCSRRVSAGSWERRHLEPAPLRVHGAFDGALAEDDPRLQRHHAAAARDALQDADGFSRRADSRRPREPRRDVRCIPQEPLPNASVGGHADAHSGVS